MVTAALIFFLLAIIWGVLALAGVAAVTYATGLLFFVLFLLISFILLVVGLKTRPPRLKGGSVNQKDRRK
ncbi:hypothetical protein CHISP_3104 [Chitinispirillum alkaliphilum]|nr:hypothetical protein CHISP_3104 [Chitinispirillum alkaliphilum]